MKNMSSFWQQPRTQARRSSTRFSPASKETGYEVALMIALRTISVYRYDQQTDIWFNTGESRYTDHLYIQHIIMLIYFFIFVISWGFIYFWCNVWYFLNCNKITIKSLLSVLFLFLNFYIIRKAFSEIICMGVADTVVVF